MPAPIVEHQDGSYAVVYVRMPGWLKNQITAAAVESGLSVTAWATNILRQGARGELNLPNPPPASHALPTPADVIAGYAKGERLLGPCGKSWPCDAAEGPVEELHGVTFCACGIRLL